MDIGLLFTNGWKRVHSNYKILVVALFFAYYLPTLIVSYVGIPYVAELEALQNIPEQELSVLWAYITSHAGLFIAGALISIIASLFLYVIPLLVFSLKKKHSVSQLLALSLPAIANLVSVIICLILTVIPGFILLIIPGIILLVYFNFALIDSVVQKSAWLAALGNSWILVKDRWWLTLGIGILIALVMMALSLPVSLALEGAPHLLNLLLNTTIFSYIFLPLSLAATACIQVFMASMSYEWYLQYRARK